jgi:ubiquinone/menaquinone biosynthesis C-methylase UbiE
MKKTSEKQHWNDFWAASRNLEDVYGTDDRIIENLLRYVDFNGLRVLEVGAGTGRDAAKMRMLGADVVGLDYSEESLALMKSSMPVTGTGTPIDIVCGDALDLPLCSETFDVVYHQGLLEHFRNPGDLLEENVRVLKKDGILLVDVPQRYHYYTVLKHILMFFGKWFAGWETEFSVRELKTMVEKHGLEVVGVYGHNLFPPIWYRGLRRILLRIGVRLPMYAKETGFVAGVRRVFRSMIPGRLYVNTAMVIGCIARRK